MRMSARKLCKSVCIQWLEETLEVVAEKEVATYQKRLSHAKIANVNLGVLTRIEHWLVESISVKRKTCGVGRTLSTFFSFCLTTPRRAQNVGCSLKKIGKSFPIARKHTRMVSRYVPLLRRLTM